MRLLTERHGRTIPPHDHCPACDNFNCNVCLSCGRAHHGGGDCCIHCWVSERRWER